MRTYRIATRGSMLALAQARAVQDQLQELGVKCELQIVKTKGDADRQHALKDIGGDGLFVRGIEQKLLANEADIAVHCGKDLPYVLAEGLVIAGVPQAADARDCLIYPADRSPETLRMIGTGSPRRVWQLEKQMPQVRAVSIRGNITTRIRKIREGEVDGIILAMAGLERLGTELDLAGLKVRPFTTDEMLPAACQGILALECRENDPEVISLLKQLNDPEALLRFETERAVFCGMKADCTSIVGVHASLCGETLTISGLFEGKTGSVSGSADQKEKLTQELIQRIYAPEKYHGEQ